MGCPLCRDENSVVHGKAVIAECGDGFTPRFGMALWCRKCFFVAEVAGVRMQERIRLRVPEFPWPDALKKGE